MTRSKERPAHATRKHLAMARQEQRATRAVLAAAGVLGAAVVVLLGYGIADRLGASRKPAVTVNGDPISRAELVARTSLRRADLAQQRQQAVDLMTVFAGSPDIRQSLQQQIAQIDAQINDTATLTGQTLQTLIRGRLVRQEAERRGIVVSEADIDAAIQQAFGFFPNGTPTASPSPTIDATLTAQVDPTRTPSPTAMATETPTVAPSSPTAEPATAQPEPTASPTPSGSPTPIPTPTVYTLQAFEENYKSYVESSKKNLGVDERYLRDQFADDLYQQRLLDSLQAEVPVNEDQVHAKHILVSDQAAALGILAKLNRGDSWDELAAANSLDTANKDNGGDLGWFGRGVMDATFEEAAFSGTVGEIVGPVQTQFGWHLILIVDRRERKLDSTGLTAAANRAFQAWLTSAIQSATLDYSPDLFAPTPTPTQTVTESAATAVATATP